MLAGTLLDGSCPGVGDAGWGHTLVMVPTALVRPSRNTSRWSMCRYSGVLMKRKWTVALSPVRRQSLSMLRMVAVCLMLPQCTAKGAGDQDRFGALCGVRTRGQ